MIYHDVSVFALAALTAMHRCLKPNIDDVGCHLCNSNGITPFFCTCGFTYKSDAGIMPSCISYTR